MPTAPPGKLGTYSSLTTTVKPPDFEPLPGAKAYFGTLGRAAYQVEIPAKWNGELVMWAHGFAGFGLELEAELPPRALRRTFIDEGYAWAGSSYSENGYVPGIGADETFALKQFFANKFGQPKRTYLVGSSMGGNVAWEYALEYPEQVNALILVDASGWEDTRAEAAEDPPVFKLLRNPVLGPLLRDLDSTRLTRGGLEAAFVNTALVDDAMVTRYVQLSRAAGHRDILLKMTLGFRNRPALASDLARDGKACKARTDDADIDIDIL